jgi:hypothetical protein
VFADYTGDGVPSERERGLMRESFERVEGALDNDREGLMFTVGYSPYYFELYDGSLPDTVDLPEPRPMSETETIEKDKHHVAIHLASYKASNVLAAEEALFGGRPRIQGDVLDADLTGYLEKKERRTGFVGEGLPAANQDVDGIPDDEPVPEEAPLFMGFSSEHGLMETHPDHGTEDEPIIHNQATESEVSIKKGPFAGGTTQHVSKIRLHLEDWYGELELDDRVSRIFEGENDAEDVGKTGEEADVPRGFINNTEEHIQEHGVVGHSEKLGRARENDRPLLLRRDINTTDEEHAGLHFVSLQRRISDFVKTRTKMNGNDLAKEYDQIGEKENNGILEFIEVMNRGNYLIPPENLMAFPKPNPQI